MSKRQPTPKDNIDAVQSISRKAEAEEKRKLGSIASRFRQLLSKVDPYR